MSREIPLDALRGSIMIVMALDHANAFIARQHPRPEMWAGPFPAYDSALSFLTRWITHLAAPGFFFLMGVSMILFADGRRRIGWSHGAIIRHLVLRGMLLIALQFLVENQAWALGDGGAFPVYFGVLYGLGAAMAVGSILVWLPAPGLAAVGVILTLITHLFAANSASASLPALARILVLPGSTGSVLVYYPLVPWLGVAALGMAFGKWLLADRDQAYAYSLFLGAAALVAFVVVRAWGGFGNIRAAEDTDWISFLNVVKYPPSTVFILLTLGIDLMVLGILARIARVSSRALVPLTVFGSAALFFYVAHLYLYASIGLLLGGRGTSIASMYPYWILGLLILAPFCYLFGAVKQQQPQNSPLRLL